MLEKYFSLFGILSNADFLLKEWGYSESFIANFPRNVGIFILMGVGIGLLKIILLVLHVIPRHKEADEIAKQVVKGEYKLWGTLGGGVTDVGLFFGFMVVNMGREIPVLIYTMLFDPPGENMAFIIIMRILTVGVALLYLAFLVVLFGPFFITFVNNMKVYKWWGLFETALDLFIGLYAFFILAAMIIAGIITSMPAFLVGGFLLFLVVKWF